MKRFMQNNFWIPALVLAALLAACENGETDPGSGTTGTAGEGDFNVVIHYVTRTDDTGLKLFSFSQGKEIPVSKKNTAEWDIGIEQRQGFLYIHTNSGASAQAWGSNGQGGVWFTDTADYDAVGSLDDRVTDLTGDNAAYADYVTDTMRWQKAMSVNVEGVMNIMTYYGYRDAVNYDGTSEAKSFQWSLPGPPANPFYEFNKKAFARVSGGMPPPWEETGQVYVIRHGDGETYSKLQFYDVYYWSGYNYRVKFKFKTLEN